MKLQQHAAQVWTMSQDVRLMPGFYLPAAGFVVRLASGGLVLISPLKGIDEIANDLRALGPVEAIVAPSNSHHLGIPKTMAAFPAARVWASKALQAKRSDIAFTDALEPDVQPPWADELVPVPIAGMPKLHETAFFHRASSVLFLVDLALNLRRPAGLFARVILGAAGPYGRFAFPRLASVGDEQALRKTVDQLIGFAPQQIIVSHGDPVTENATDVLKKAFAFLPP